MAKSSHLLVPVAENWDWQVRGLCRGKDSQYFFHPADERGAARAAREERAKAICRSCPVLVRCRQHALTVEEPFGIWGAMGERERREAISHRRRLRKAS